MGQNDHRYPQPQLVDLTPEAQDPLSLWNIVELLPLLMKVDSNLRWTAPSRN